MTWQIRTAAHHKNTKLPQEPPLHLAARQCAHRETSLRVLQLLLAHADIDRGLRNSASQTARGALESEPPTMGDDAAAPARIAQAHALLAAAGVCDS